MRMKQLGKTGLMVTPVGFGVLTIGENQLRLPLEEGAAVVRHGLARGINFLDTAQYYRTYEYIREALRGTPYNPVICSKSLGCSFEDMWDAVEEARIRLDRDVIEIFLLHEMRNAPDWEMRQGAWEALQKAKAQGLVKAIGVSTHHVDVAEAMADIPACDVLFPLINRESLGIRKGNSFGTRTEMEAAIRAFARDGRGVFAMKAFGGGNLVGSYRECLDYVTALPGVASTMIGFGTCEEVDRAVAYFEGTLPQDYTPDLSWKRIMVDPGDCEGCGACVLRCPNHAIRLDESGIARIDPNACLTCGYCAPVCPVRAIILC